jgi:DNA-binding response OmpR family regulator
MPTRILFVDDEPGIRETLPVILRRHGFQVTSAATVAEALAAITSASFEVLISDLNIGHAGDGFTVVSAMRRTQPACINFILTGYPALESALRAIRNQVDDYLIKPAQPRELVAAIERALQQKREPHDSAPPKHVADVLADNVAEITKRVVSAMKKQPQLERLELSDEQLRDGLPALVQELAEMLRANNGTPAAQLMHSAALRGRLRQSQGFTIPMLIENLRLLEAAAYDVIHENMLLLELSELMPDLKRLNDSIALQLRESIAACLTTPGQAA